MKLEFKRDEQREARGREFAPEKWKAPNYSGPDPKNWPTLARYFKPDDGARKAPEGDKVKLGEDEYSTPTEVYADGRLRSLSYEEDEEGFLKVEKELSYEQTCETVDLSAVLPESIKDSPITRDDVLKAAREVMLAKAEGSATAHHWESIEGDYELFDAFEADWLSLQAVPTRWTRMGLTLLTGFLEQLRDGTFGAEDKPDVSGKSIELAALLEEVLGLRDADLTPTLFDFYC